MTQQRLAGVIAAIPTPFDETGAPDPAAFVRLGADLLANGCDALNVLGTTGEATSLSVDERETIMRAAASGLPLERMMVGTGAASVSDAARLTRLAAELQFSGALILPPFYYKGVSEEGLLTYLAAIVAASAESALPLYLYHFPALSGVPWPREIVAAAMKRFPGRIVGLKDSSGDLDYARSIASLDASLAVFPSNEVVLSEARKGVFAGCISGSANVNADLCAKAWAGDEDAQAKAVAIRKLFDGMNLVAGVKALLAAERHEPGLAATRPPLVAYDDATGRGLAMRAAAIRAGTPPAA